MDFNELDEKRRILFLYSEGAGDAEICKALNISKEDFDERSKNNAVFRKLISFGRTIALAWWEEKLRKVSFGEEKGNPAVIKLVILFSSPCTGTTNPFVPFVANINTFPVTILCVDSLVVLVEQMYQVLLDIDLHPYMLLILY